MAQDMRSAQPYTKWPNYSNKQSYFWTHKGLFEQKLMYLDQMLKFGNILKAITNFKIHQNLFNHLFTLLHFAMDDPVAT